MIRPESNQGVIVLLLKMKAGMTVTKMVTRTMMEMLWPSQISHKQNRLGYRKKQQNKQKQQHQYTSTTEKVRSGKKAPVRYSDYDLYGMQVKTCDIKLQARSALVRCIVRLPRHCWEVFKLICMACYFTSLNFF